MPGPGTTAYRAGMTTTMTAGAADHGGTGIDVRLAGESEGPEWQRALHTGFLRHGPGAEPSADWWRRHFEPGRFLGAWDGERCVGTFRSIPMELTVPGGAVLPADGIADVTVTSTHRRRGLLTRMMRRDLALARERGDVFALLTAAEYGIYGRSGFGRATRFGGWTIDVPRSGGLRPGIGELDPGARIELIGMAELRGVAPGLYDRYRRTRHGAISRPPDHWKEITGEAALAGGPPVPFFAAAHRDGDGRVTGLLTYHVEQRTTGGDPDATLTVLDHVAPGPAAAAALWRYALETDLVRRIAIGNIAPDDPLPLWLVNPRAAVRTERPGDDLWVRVLDGPRAFAARRYDVPGRTVLDVSDPEGPLAGRWLLETSEDGTGRLSPTTAEPELRLDAAALGAVYLGGATVPQLAAARLVTELRHGAAARAGLQLRTATEPWCPDRF